MGNGRIGKEKTLTCLLCAKSKSWKFVGVCEIKGNGRYRKGGIGRKKIEITGCSLLLAAPFPFFLPTSSRPQI